MAGELDREIGEYMRKLRSGIADYRKRDRKQVLTKAAAPVRKAARNLTPKGTKIHKRYNSGRARAAKGQGQVRAIYHPGNLRRSIKTLDFKRSQDVFVGPSVGGKAGVVSYGLPGQPVDGYYAVMVFGSKAAFIARVLKPAMAATATIVRKTVGEETLKKIKQRAAGRGISTR